MLNVIVFGCSNTTTITTTTTTITTATTTTTILQLQLQPQRQPQQVLLPLLQPLLRLRAIRDTSKRGSFTITLSFAEFQCTVHVRFRWAKNYSNKIIDARDETVITDAASSAFRHPLITSLSREENLDQFQP